MKRLSFFLSFVFFLFISNSAWSADVPDDLILYGEDSVTLESEACVSGGSVVSGGDLTLGETAGIMGDVYVWANLTMADGSYITGDADVGLTATLDGTAVIEGTLSESVTDLPEVSIPTTTSPTGSTGVKVKPGEMKILVSGNYSSVSVAPMGTLILRGGTYNIKELILSKGSQIKIKSTTQIVVGTSLNWGAKKSLPDDLTRRVSGLTVSIANKTKNSVSGYFKGIMYVPNGSVEIENGGEVVGVVEAKSVTVDTGGLIRSASGSTECSDTEAGGDDSDAADAGADDSGDSDAGADDSGDTSDDSGDVDAGVADAGADDSGDSDAGAVDAGAADAGVDDSGDSDAGVAGADDSGDTSDVGADDSGDSAGSSTEDGTTDSGTSDAGSADGSDTSEGSDGSDGLPSDPADVAPDLDTTVTTTTYTATEFLYTGDNPIQTGVSEGTIEPTRVAAIRGEVYDKDGNVLSGVTISILDHDEYGSTITRSDGMFDMVVNGGNYLTIVYQKDGYPTVHRKIDAPWQGYIWADDVVMVEYDSTVTTVDLSGATTTIQIAEGTESTDDDGTRTATILFPSGTTATMTLEDGSAESLTEINVRATEFTVGDNGPEAMPASLPVNSAYTYAVELSVDEAITAEATEVTFNQPVYFYVENFLNFPTGETVPAGYYDEKLGAWVPSDNGVIIEVLGDTDGDGITEVDIDGDELADDVTTLSEYGFTDEERQTLTTRYSTGQTLWRVAMSHFSTWDCNWGFGPPDGAEYPESEPSGNEDENNSCEQPGSIIECQNQTLGEAISLNGTPFELNYRSSRVPGRVAANTIKVKLTPSSIPATVQHILLEITVAGRFFEEELPASDDIYEFTWDGLDAYGRKVQGAQLAKVRIGYTYQGAYLTTAGFGRSGGGGSGTSPGGYVYGGEITGSRTRQEIGLWKTYTVLLGSVDEKEFGLGAWSVTPHHFYDVNGATVYFGNGEKRSHQNLPYVIKTVAGTGTAGYSGDSKDATEAKLRTPTRVAVDNQGNLFIADRANHVVRKVDTDGIITTVAGTGSRGYSGDGGDATSAKLYYPQGLAFDKNGDLYIADSYNHVVRKVDTAGIISTVAGTGTHGYTGDEGAATDAELYYPYGVALDSEGNLYIAEYGNYVVRKVDTAGIISTVAGTGTLGYSGDDGLATDATLRRPSSVALDRDGNLYVVDSNPSSSVVRKIDTAGIISTVAGIGGTAYYGDGDLATDAPLDSPYDVAVDKNGNLYVADTGNDVIRKIGTDGIITTIAGVGDSYGYTGDKGPALLATLDSPQGVAIDKEGHLYIADSNNTVIRKLDVVLPSFTNTDFTVFSEDGNLVYEFNAEGRHESTVDTLTGTTIYSFGYDSNNFLETITDVDGNVTTINRDSDGVATSIQGPYGQKTTLEFDSNGYLKTFTNEAGEFYSFTYYDDDGLLETITNPRGYTSTFEYDELGYLEKDTNAATNAQTLSREDTDDGYQVSYSSAEGVSRIYKVETDSTDEKTWTNTFPDGTQSTVVFGNDGSKKITTPDGTTTNLEIGPDPRFGMESPLPENYTITTPAGLEYEFSLTRDAELTDEDDLLSLTTQTDTITLNGKTYTSVYDAASYTETFTTPESRKVVTTLDSKGKLKKEQLGTTLEPVSYEYDSNGRLSTITLGTTDPRVYTFTYYSTSDPSNGLLKTITDPLSQVASFEYDDSGRVTTETKTDGKTISYSYDEDGNLTSVTPPSKPAHAIHYNNLDLEDVYTPPDIGLTTNTTQYSYNKDKQPDIITRPDGKTIDYEYDSAGKISSVDADGDVYSYAYSSTTGLLNSISDPSGGSLSFTYDGNLLLTSSLTGEVTGSVGFTYNDDFKVTKETINSTSYSFDYDDDGLLTTAGSLSLTRSSDHGMITNTTLSGVTSTIGYTEIGELESEDFSYAGSSLYSTTYTRDDLGRITDKTVINSGTTIPFTYSYDTAGRLETATYVASTTTYTYDDNGNRLTKTKDGVTTIATYDDQDRLETYGDNTYTYTNNGELLTKTNTEGTTTYDYDVLGNLRSVSLPDGTEIEYVIDGQNRRVGKKEGGTLTQGFIYKDQLKPIAELDGSNNIVSTFIYASKENVPDYMVKDGTTYRIISDHLGSPQLIVNVSDGSIVQEITYDEFGNILSDTNPGFQPFGFAGGIYDADTKLTRFGSRDYDAETGRWTLKDPIGFKGRDSNLYGYVLNDPLNLTDRNGLWATGFSIDFSTINPFTSGGGGSYGINLEYTSDSGWHFYTYGTPNEQGSVGFLIGPSFQVNFATGEGDWSGPFDGGGGSFGPVCGGYFESSNPDLDDPAYPGYFGISLGAGKGPPGVGFTTTNYTKQW